MVISLEFGILTYLLIQVHHQSCFLDLVEKIHVVQFEPGKLEPGCERKITLIILIWVYFLDSQLTFHSVGWTIDQRLTHTIWSVLYAETLKCMSTRVTHIYRESHVSHISHVIHGSTTHSIVFVAVCVKFVQHRCFECGCGSSSYKRTVAIVVVSQVTLRRSKSKVDESPLIPNAGGKRIYYWSWLTILPTLPI